MKKMTIATALMSSFLLLTACQSPEDNDDTDTDNTEDTTEQTEEDTSTDTDDSNETEDNNETDDQELHDTKGIQDHEFDLSLEDAVDTFHDKYGDMEIYAVELTTEDGVYQYEIKGQKDNTEYKAHIDADSGDILSEKEENDDDNHMEIDFDQLISPKDAMDEALNELDEDAYITSWELEEEDNKMAYEIEYDFEDDDKDDGDITIDAYNGDVLEK